MPDETSAGNGQVKIPPKLDLFKSGIPKAAAPTVSPMPSPAPVAATSAAQPITIKAPSSAPAPKPLGVKPVASPATAGQPITTMKAPSSPIGPKPLASAGVAQPITIKAQGGPASGPQPLAVKPMTPSAGIAGQPMAVKPALSPMTAKPTLSMTAKPAIPENLEKVPTTVLAKPPASVQEQQAPAATDAAEQVSLISKRETSKIPLTAAKIMPSPKIGQTAGSPIKSIGGEATAIKLGKPTIIHGPSETTDPSSPKHTTSRISLESVLSSSGEESDSGPKTIKLKKPSSTGAIKIKDDQTTESDIKTNLAKTSRLDEIPEEAEDTASKRKTIRVKRAGASTDGQETVVKRTDAGQPAGGVTTPFAFSQQDEPGGVFIAIAIVAILVTITTTYMFASQAFESNVALPWPGKISTQ